MDLETVMRTTFAAREFTDEVIDDTTLYRLLELARFAPSGGNRQGWRVIIVKKPDLRRQLTECMRPTVNRYIAQVIAGEVPYNTINESQLDPQQVTSASHRFPLVENLELAPVVLLVCVDLAQVTSFDASLNRVGVISGASVYPFVWNILLAARSLGLGGVLTTFLAESEPAVRQLMAMPDSFAVASLVVLGRPVRQLKRLTRHPVDYFTRIDTWDGMRFNEPDSKLTDSST